MQLIFKLSTARTLNTVKKYFAAANIKSVQHAAPYFKKLECFCFAKQTLQPGETRKMPVVFVIDPKAPDDLGTITLSYTFFEVEGAATDIQGAVKPPETSTKTRSNT